MTRGAMAERLEPYDLRALIEALSDIPGWGVKSIRLLYNYAFRMEDGDGGASPASDYHMSGFMSSTKNKPNLARQGQSSSPWSQGSS